MRDRELWIFLFITGVLVFNWPFTAMADVSVPLYVFIVWAGFIAAMRILAGRGGTESGDG